MRSRGFVDGRVIADFFFVMQTSIDIPVNGVIGSKLWSFYVLVDMNTDFVSQFARRSYGRGLGLLHFGCFFVWIEHGMGTVAYIDQNNFTNKFRVRFSIYFPTATVDGHHCNNQSTCRHSIIVLTETALSLALCSTQHTEVVDTTAYCISVRWNDRPMISLVECLFIKRISGFWNENRSNDVTIGGNELMP
jgi:hypothetical protein